MTGSSTRIRRLVFAVLVAIVLVPAVIVIAVERLARKGRAEIAVATEAAAREAASTTDRDALHAIAARHQVRLWIAERSTMRTVFDTDRQPKQRSDIGMSSFGGMIDLADFDDGRAAPAQREHAVVAARQGWSSGCATFADEELLVCEAAVRTADGNVVLVQRAAPRVASRLADAREGLLLLGGAVLVAGVVLAGWLVRRLTRPLAALDRQVAARARGEQQTIAIAGAPREIAEVARTVDDLAGRLEHRRRRDAEAAADLAHELKSPLARIKLALDAGALDSAARAALDDTARRAVVAIDRTLADLLEIARTEAGLLDEPRVATDLRALAGQVVGDRPPPPAIAVELIGAKTAGTIAPNAVARALGHLLDNAYAHAASRVTVEVRATSILVRDDGPGVPAELLPRLFERFASRRTGGTGLGLAFVRAVAEAHGGAATWTDGAFVIRLGPGTVHTASTNV